MTLGNRYDVPILLKFTKTAKKHVNASRRFCRRLKLYVGMYMLTNSRSRRCRSLPDTRGPNCQAGVTVSSRGRWRDRKKHYFLCLGQNALFSEIVWCRDSANTKLFFVFAFCFEPMKRWVHKNTFPVEFSTFVAYDIGCKFYVYFRFDGEMKNTIF